MKPANNNPAVSHSGSLPAMVAINEDIKDIMRIANQINMAAINAMLIANKIGRSSSGFSVVSAELRTFSLKLSEAMHLLLAHVSKLVHEVAGMIRLSKALHLQQTMCSLASNRQYLQAVLEHKACRLDESASSLRQHQGLLAAAIARASKLCVMGLSLSYSAKIEAVYGEAQAGALKQVSEGVEHAITAILHTLNKLEKQLEAAA